MRRLPLVAVAVVTVLCVVGVAILAVAAGGSALAYEVNGSRVSQSTVDGVLDDLANATATEGASNTPGSVDSRASAQVLSLNIALDLMRDAAEKRGVKVTDDDRSAARSDIGSQLSGYPASYRDLVVDVRAYGRALGLSDDTALDDFVTRQFRRADVYVNPKYGFWNPRFGVCPPTGCASLNTGTGG